MTYRIGLAAFLAVLVLAAAGGAQAGNRKAFNALMAEAESWCEQIRKDKVYACSVEKCPCADGLREVRRFDKLRTRAACVCTPDTGRPGANAAGAADFCVSWNRSHGKEGDRCFIVAGGSCPPGTAELREFRRLRGHGPGHTACRGEPPREEDEEKSGEAAGPQEAPPQDSPGN